MAVVFLMRKQRVVAKNEYVCVHVIDLLPSLIVILLSSEIC